MKNILMSLALLGTFAAMSAKGDSYLYWMTDLTSAGDLYKNADTAVLIATQTAGTPGRVIGAAAIANGVTPRMASDSIANMGAGWSFYVELYQGNSWLGQSAAEDYKDYNSAFAAGAIYKSLDPNGLAKVSFTSFTNVPEPTSGLLVLLGVCGLALKRKRA